MDGSVKHAEVCLQHPYMDYRTQSPESASAKKFQPHLTGYFRVC